MHTSFASVVWWSGVLAAYGSRSPPGASLMQAGIESRTRHRALGQDQGAGRDLAATVVFGFGIDPQRGEAYAQDDLAHIDKWYQSCEDQGLTCMVLHDAVLSEQFASNYTTDHVTFHRSHPVDDAGEISDPELQDFTTADMRFMQFLEYLKSDEGQDVEYALLTDAHDVAFKESPFTLMRAMDTAMNTKYMFVQEEWRPRAALGIPSEPNMTALSRLVPYWKNCFGEEMPEAYTWGRMPNCGVLGGHREAVIPFLERMRHWYTTVPNEQRFRMCDMVVFFKTIMEDYEDRVISGYPFHAKFKNLDSQEQAAIFHKNDGYV